MARVRQPRPRGASLAGRRSSYELYLILRVGRPVRQVTFSGDGTKLFVLREGETAVRCWRLDPLRKRFVEMGLDR